jgi:hypothetical protein
MLFAFSLVLAKMKNKKFFVCKKGNSMMTVVGSRACQDSTPGSLKF